MKKMNPILFFVACFSFIFTHDIAGKISNESIIEQNINEESNAMIDSERNSELLALQKEYEWLSQAHTLLVKTFQRITDIYKNSADSGHSDENSKKSMARLVGHYLALKNLYEQRLTAYNEQVEQIDQATDIEQA